MRVKNFASLKAMAAANGMDVDEEGAVAMGRATPAQAPVNLAPILEAIRSLPKPQVVMAGEAQASPKKWTFTVVRDEDGFMEKIIAEAN